MNKNSICIAILQESKKLAFYKRFCILCFSFLLLAVSLFAQAPKPTGNLHGQVTDPSGAVVIGAAVTVTSPDGTIQKVVSDKQGAYYVHGVPAGSAIVTATASGFAAYSMPNVIVPAGQSQQLDISFAIIGKSEQVTVQSETATVDVNPENNASATVLKEKDLEALSDDPDELEQDLLALAGPSAGPNGGQIYIDGFSNGTLPPKSSIREVRINQNPFSSEYDRPGFGRVEVFTKPGTDTWHGQIMFNESDHVLNSRNPYISPSADIPPYHTERYSGNVSGALSKKLSINLNLERRDINELSAIDATTPDPATGLPENPALAPVLSPETRTNVSPRIDWQVTPSNTLSARYQYMRNAEFNQGIGTFTLASRADAYHHTMQTVQLTDTQVLSTHLINETRFQYLRDEQTNSPNSPGVAAINVPGEFNTGGNPTGITSDTTSYYELQSYTSWSAGKHSVKFGGRLRASQDNNLAYTNFNGTVTYTGSATAAVTPLQAYLAGTPSQVSIVSGSPFASVSYADVGVYAEDDWKLRPNLTLSYGLRFESQSAINNKSNFAPRLGLSWGLGSAKSAPKTVVRLGYGIFYDRFSSDLVLQAQRLNGSASGEQETIYTASSSNPIQCPQVALGSYSAGQPPSFSFYKNDGTTTCTLPAATSSPTIYQINPNLHAPYTMQIAASLERQLGSIGTVSFTYLNSRGIHQFDTINANAPDASGVRPGAQDVYQYYSEGIFKQNQLITNVQIRLSQKFSLMGFYALGYVNSDVSGVSNNPSNANFGNGYRLTDDYGRASFDIRNRLFLSGTASLAHNIRISPFVIANSGAPFNITTGTDLNGDSFYNDRPSLVDGSYCVSGSGQYVSKSYGCFNLTPGATEKRIPVNYGKGPSNVQLNLRVSKTFGFGADTKKPKAADSGPGGPAGPGGGGRGPGGPPGGGFGGPRGMGNLFGGANTTRRYNLTIAAMGRNLFNTWNPGLPIGNLSSSSFGKSNSLAGGPFSSGTANRRFDLSATFTF